MTYGQAGTRPWCSIEGCERRAHAKFLCDLHYQRQRSERQKSAAPTPRPWLGVPEVTLPPPALIGRGVRRMLGWLGRDGDRRSVSANPVVPPRRRKNAGVACEIAGCERSSLARGLCQRHYGHWRRQREPGPPRKRRGPHPCSVTGCDRSRDARGFCSRHYKRWVRHGDPGPPGPIARGPHQRRGSLPCSVTGCDRSGASRGFCSRHYSRWLRHGDPGPPGPIALGPHPWTLRGPRPCSIVGCDRTIMARELCHSHYQRWRIHGDPHYAGPLRPDANRGNRCMLGGCSRVAREDGRCAHHALRRPRPQE